MRSLEDLEADVAKLQHTVGKLQQINDIMLEMLKGNENSIVHNGKSILKLIELQMPLADFVTAAAPAAPDAARHFLREVDRIAGAAVQR